MPTDLQVLGAQAASLLPHVQSILSLSDVELNKLVDRVHCFAFKVRLPRKDDRSCNKTPYFDRFDINASSYLIPQDPKYATQEQCQAVAAMLLAQLFEAQDLYPSLLPHPDISGILGHSPVQGSLTCKYQGRRITANDIKRALSYSTPRLGNYDISTTYIQELDDGGLHRADNVTWMKPVHINYKLRSVLRQKLLASGATSKAANTALDKIQVKAYCTDKQTMPPHFSNRDVRWETWHESHQFASHYECAMIEMELMAELFEFHGAPDLNPELSAEVADVRGKPIQKDSMKCYITGKNFSFESYVDGAVNTHGGKSNYHVGHITPLTRGGKHSWQNIAWIGDDGNRIQGNETIEEIEQKLITAVEYHLKRDMHNGSEDIQPKILRLLALINEMRDSQGRPRFEW